MAKYGGALVLMGVLFLFGCDGKPSTSPVSGTVTFDGQPIPDGDIIFLDVENKIGPDAGNIVDGKFAFQAKTGKKKVEIRAMRLQKLPPGTTSSLGETEVPANYIPERYNTKTELTADVASNGSNSYEFKLTSK